MQSLQLHAKPWTKPVKPSAYVIHVLRMLLDVHTRLLRLRVYTRPQAARLFYVFNVLFLKP